MRESMLYQCATWTKAATTKLTTMNIYSHLRNLLAYNKNMRQDMKKVQHNVIAIALSFDLSNFTFSCAVVFAVLVARFLL